MGKDRRTDILNAAVELFARRGFRGTTTRDLAAQADVNEAIIFRHFKSKGELYSAILEKACEGRNQASEEIERYMESGDDSRVLEALGRQALEKLNERDGMFFRLLLFSALEGHELSEMFFANTVRPAREELAGYIQRRIDDGAFRRVDPALAARAFIGMFVSFVLSQEVFAQKQYASFDRDEVVRAFISIFLSGIKDDHK